MVSLLKCFGCIAEKPPVVQPGKAVAPPLSPSVSVDSSKDDDDDDDVSSQPTIEEPPASPPPPERSERIKSNRVMEVHRALQEREDAMKPPPLQAITSDEVRKSRRISAIHARLDELTEAAKVPGPESLLPGTDDISAEGKRASDKIIKFTETLEQRDRDAQDEPRLLKTPPDL